MLYTSLAEFNCYINNYEDSVDIQALKTSILETAESIVEEYLGYSPIQSTEVEHHVCQGHAKLYPDKRPIYSITELLQNGDDITVHCLNMGSYIHSDKFIKGSDIKITYTAGWLLTNLPPEIKVTTLRIASLLYAETGGSIGLSSRTSPDGSKTYISYYNYSKYLSPLDRYRRIKL